MSDLVFTLLIVGGSAFAGMLGALTGLGGGIIVIPLLTLGFGIDLNYAIGASLVSVIATSSGAAPAFIKEGITNMRIGLFLEIATTIGAVMGAILAIYIGDKSVISIIFGMSLMVSVIAGLRKKKANQEIPYSKWAGRLRLNGSYPVNGEEKHYKVTRVMGGFSMMSLAGVLSGMLGIGSGAFKVLAMDNIMKMPFKVSTTTSNFMIGVTAAASAVVYLQQGYIVPKIAGAVMLGVLVGSTVGSKLVVYVNTKWLKKVFTIVVAFVAVQMIYKGWVGSI